MVKIPIATEAVPIATIFLRKRHIPIRTPPTMHPLEKAILIADSRHKSRLKLRITCNCVSTDNGDMKMVKRALKTTNK
jgi:hypothetical protein